MYYSQKGSQSILWLWKQWGLVEEIIAHKWTKNDLEFQIKWTAGDVTWELLSSCKDLEALDNYFKSFLRLSWDLKVLDTDHRCISDKVHPTLPFSAIPSVPKVHSYFCHISDTPPFIPVPLVSPFIPMFPVSLISISMPLWSSHLLPKFSPLHSCHLLFHASTFCS